MEHKRKHLLEQLSVLLPPVLATINKNVVLPGMGMQITVHRHPTFLQQSANLQVARYPFNILRSFLNLPSYHQLGVPYGRIRFSDDRSVLPVQISARQRATVIADYDTVGIQHRHYFEDEFFAKLFGSGRVAG